ncbi:hypothetical protein [Flocculibacter collagenilyticus]|uniref:hypothetical protein n=1 Tax=Flocculibacter collagenilyticus TaxID=2744479 RepID=UPI0018F77C4D|nr:hypothetical protein [Flocculibacter collagenilyticus]
MRLKSLTLALSVSLLASCGGSSSSDNSNPPPITPENKTITGKVIDGYVRGATVWLDFNGNGQFDEGEPTAVSGDAGNYLLELTATEAKCAAYTAVYVDVPVGAYDEDQGEVTEAYQMYRPPLFAAITDDTLLNISPLTTVLWEGVKAELGITPVESCTALLNDQEKRDKMKERLSNTIYNTVNKYNISSEKIFSDFIAENDAETTLLALEIVKGLKQSFAYASSLETQYPNATERRVVHYQDTHVALPDPNEHVWFRDVHISYGDAGYLGRKDQMNDSLTQVIRPIYYRDVVAKPWNSGRIETTTDVRFMGGETDQFDCSFSEQVLVNSNGVEYSISNSSKNLHLIDDHTNCQPTEVGSIGWRNFSAYYNEGGKSFFTSVSQWQSLTLPHWIDLANNEEAFDTQELIDELSVMGYKFDEEVQIPYNSWYKRYDFSQGDQLTQVTKNNEGLWERFIRAKDGTHTTECSFDGETWEACLED